MGYLEKKKQFEMQLLNKRMYDVICPEAITVLRPPRVEPQLLALYQTVFPSNPTYDKFLLGIRDTPDRYFFDLIFVEDQKYLELDSIDKCEPPTFRPITGVIRKIHLFYWPHDGTLFGIRLYDVTGTLIYESACKLEFTWSFVK